MAILLRKICIAALSFLWNPGYITVRMDADFIQARIDAIEERIAAYDTAITALISGVDRYSLDTGQTKQSVTKKDILKLQEAQQFDIGQLDFWYQQLNGGGSIYLRPAY